MAHAVKNLFPGAKIAIGPSIEEGFYYDFDVKEPFTPEDLDKISAEMENVIKARRRELEEDPLFVHPAEVKDRISELDAVQRSLRPAPVVLHLDGLRVKIPYKEWKDQIAAVEVYGHRLGDIATLTDSRLGGSTLITIKTRSEVEAQDAKARKA
jgi:methyl coenzyme M reductase subunit C-like uncharacterized protein (methanogenesis marker protein 7)